MVEEVLLVLVVNSGNDKKQNSGDRAGESDNGDSGGTSGGCNWFKQLKMVSETGKDISSGGNKTKGRGGTGRGDRMVRKSSVI